MFYILIITYFSLYLRWCLFRLVAKEIDASYGEKFPFKIFSAVMIARFKVCESFHHCDHVPSHLAKIHCKNPQL